MSEIIHRRAKLDDLKDIVSLLADYKLGRTREQTGNEVAQEHLVAFAKIDIGPNQYLIQAAHACRQKQLESIQVLEARI